MDWTLLLLLACPLMMLFCMKGMFSGNKQEEKGAAVKEKAELSAAPGGQGLESIQLKLADLMEQNQQLLREVEALRAQEKNDTSADNVVQLEEEKEEGKKIQAI